MQFSRRHLLFGSPILAGSAALAGSLQASENPPLASSRVRTQGAFYVDPVNGVDGPNDGLNPGAAFRTIDYAFSFIRENVDTAGSAVIVKLLDGTHEVGSGANAYYALTGSGQVVVLGNMSDPEAVVVNCDGGGNCFSIQEPATLTIGHIKLTTSGRGSVGILARQFATCDIQQVVFGDFPGGMHAKAEDISSINMLAPGYAIKGGATLHLAATNGSKVTLPAIAVEIPSPQAFEYFGYAADGGMIVVGSTSFTGAGRNDVTGREYFCADGGIIRKSGVRWPSNAKGVLYPGGSVDDVDTRNEDNVWTPIDLSGAGLTFPAWGNTTFIKEGKQVTAYFFVQFPSTRDKRPATIGGLQYPCVGGIATGGGPITYTNVGKPITALMVSGGGAFNVADSVGRFLTNADLSSCQIRGVVTYRTA